MPRTSPPAEAGWTVLKLLLWAADYLKGRGIDSPRATAEILLAHALKTERVRLYMEHDKPLQPAELAVFKAFLKRRLRREPVAYITGRKGFWTLDLAVNAAVLIPRPETESLVEAALSILAPGTGEERLQVLDLGTGSGAIVLALAVEAPRHRYRAVDISAEAVAVARSNARELGVEERVDFIIADWFSAFKPETGAFDLIVSNPPYIAGEALAGLQPEIREFEPRLALEAGFDGLRSYREILAAAGRHLKTGGRLVLEIGHDQRRAVGELAESLGGFRLEGCLKDYAGRDRVVILQKKIAR